MAKESRVRKIAQGRWRDILTALGIQASTLAGKHCPCPLCGGKDRFRFDDQEGRGTYFCTQCGAGDGMHLALSFTGRRFKDLAEDIERLAGALPIASCRPARSDADKYQGLCQTWKEATPLQRGDEAERYLRNRGLALPDLPASLRVHPGLPYYDDDHKFRGVYPVMLAAVTRPTRELVKLHRTYLQDGQKAPLKCAKKLMSGLPSAGGGAIRLFRASKTLGIAEGIETALAAAELFGLPVWSCVAASGLESFIPPEGVEAITIFGDNDLNFTGQAVAYAAARRLVSEGYSVTVKIPDAPGDWLDVLRATSTENTEV